MNPEQKPAGGWREFWAKAKELAFQGLIVIAAIILVILVAWGIIKLVPAVITSVESGGASLSSIFSPKESLDLTATPSTVPTGTPINLSWKHASPSGAGTYSISFACVPGVTMKLRNSAGGDQTIACAKQASVGSAMSAVITPSSAQNRLVEFPVTVAFSNTATGAAGPVAQASVTITNDSLPFVGATSTDSSSSNSGASSSATPVKPAKTVSHAQYGKADLAITVLGQGIVDPASGQFIATPAISSGQKAAVRFSVKNIGTRSSGRWTWSAVLPNAGAQVYNAPTEPSLAPGSSIVFTLGFDNVVSGQPLTISVDDIRAIPDANRNNNAVQIPFAASSSGYSYGNYTYGNYGYSNGSGYGYANGTAYNYPTTVPTNYGTGYGYGTPDLSAAIVTVDGGSYGYSGGNHTIQVKVTNIGSAASGTWTYIAQLPGNNCQNTIYNGGNYSAGPNGNISCNGSQAVYTGSQQSPLAPGQSTTLTINFSSGTNSACAPVAYNPYSPYSNGYNSGCSGNQYGSAGGTFSFTANPNGFPELRTDNNTASTYVQG